MAKEKSYLTKEENRRMFNKNKALTVKGELEQIKQMEKYKGLFYLNMK